MSDIEIFENPILEILTGEDAPPDWLVKDIITQGSFGCLVGESGAGKSYVSYMLAMAIAAGVPIFGGLIPAGPPKRVLYFDNENSEQDRNKYLRRLWLGLKKQNGKEPDVGLLYKNFWPVRAALGDENWVETCKQAIEQVKPHAMFFDTANACFNVDDENSNSEARKAIHAIKKLQEMTVPMIGAAANATVLKHARTRTEKGQIRTVRGAKIWKDLSDWFLFQVKAPGRKRRDGLSLTRLIPDKVRAYGLQRQIYITPDWTDAERTGFMLKGSYKPDIDHHKAEKEDEEWESLR
jgi:hypothetical protein